MNHVVLPKSEPPMNTVIFVRFLHQLLDSVLKEGIEGLSRASACIEAVQVRHCHFSQVLVKLVSK